MKTCYDNNLQVLLHANGDAAIDFLLEAHKAAAGTDLAKDRRTVCIHCQFIRPDQLKAVRRAEAHPLALHRSHLLLRRHPREEPRPPAGELHQPHEGRARPGLAPTNHTDAFVVPVDQMMTVWTAVNRPLRSGGTLGADQRISPL